MGVPGDQRAETKEIIPKKEPSFIDTIRIIERRMKLRPEAQDLVARNIIKDHNEDIRNVAHILSEKLDTRPLRRELVQHNIIKSPFIMPMQEI